MKEPDQFLFFFAVETWTSPGKFKAFLGPPFKKTPDTEAAIQSCVDHTQKFRVLASLANRIRPMLMEDAADLENRGYSKLEKSNEYAALFEVLICELYCVLDGLRAAIFELFSPCRGVQKTKTSKLFSLASENRYGPEFPAEIRDLLAAAYADWFLELRRLRTAFTHGGLGKCHFDPAVNRVTYMNTSLGNDPGRNSIHDVEAYTNATSGKVFALQNGIFEHLYGKLEQIESTQFCGVYKSRFYSRKVFPVKNLHSGSGKCDSHQWFKTDQGHFCPMADTCEAYTGLVKVEQ